MSEPSPASTDVRPQTRWQPTRSNVTVGIPAHAAAFPTTSAAPLALWLAVWLGSARGGWREPLRDGGDCVVHACGGDRRAGLRPYAPAGHAAVLLDPGRRPAAPAAARAAQPQWRAQGGPGCAPSRDRGRGRAGRGPAVQRQPRRPDAAGASRRPARADDPQRHGRADEHPLPRAARLGRRGSRTTSSGRSSPRPRSDRWSSCPATTRPGPTGTTCTCTGTPRSRSWAGCRAC